ncbi:unnamed protein product [Calypogeia fissa]
MARTGYHEQQQLPEQEEDADTPSFGVSPVQYADVEEVLGARMSIIIRRSASSFSNASSSVASMSSDEFAKLDAARTSSTGVGIQRHGRSQGLDFVEHDAINTGMPEQPLEISMSRKQGWLPFPPAKKHDSRSSSTSDDSEADGNSSIETPSDGSPSSSSIPSPREKLYEIKVKKLFYKLPPRKPSILSKLKRCCSRHPKHKDDDMFTGSTTDRYILRNINFDAKPGELLAIAGPSGAGKSTILECLAGRVTPSSPPGCILVNNQVMNASTFRRISGYVMQDDALFPTLTVVETLLFSARLRLSSSMPMAEKLSRVQDLLVELGLQHAANTRIGNDIIRGVSGGERRRVSIGVDVINDPAVLILDEPTSGLDSGAALNVVAMLRAMAVSRSRTIILSIHQPSFRILELMHSILLVAGGMVVHHGSLDLLAARLATAGHEVPAQTNVMEYAIDAVNSWETEEYMGSYATIAKRLTLQDLFALGEDFQSSDSSLVDLESGLDSNSKLHEGPDHDQGSRFQQQGGGDDDYPDKISYANNIVLETAVLTERFFKNILRTKELFTARSIQAVFAGVILGTVFLNVDNNRQGVQDRLGFFVFTLSFLLNSTTEALPIFLQERQILLRETSRGAYRIASYVLSHAVVFFPFLFSIAVLYGTPSYWLAGLTSSVGSFLFYCLVLWLTLLLANSFAAFFSALVPNYITGQALISAFMGAFFLFSGYVINRHEIPDYWIWMHYLSLFKYPFDALLLNEFGPHKTKCYDRGLSSYGGTEITDRDSFCLLTGRQVLHNSGVQGHQKWNDVFTMIGFIVFYRISCYITVRWRLTKRNR